MKDRLEYQATCEFIKEKFLHQIDFTDDTILKSERKYAKAFSDSACDFYFGFTNSVLFTSKGVFSPKTQKNHNFDTINKMINVDKFLKKGLYLNDGNNDNKLGESIPESILEQFAFETEDKMLFVTRRIQIMKMQKRLDLKIKEKEEAEEAEAEAARKVIIAEAEAARKVIITDLYNKIKANSITVLDVKSAVSKARKVIKENETHISKLNNEIGLNKRSILHENELKKFPSQAIGTITLYNKLNENYSLYNEGQFNKVIRFVQHTEDKEKKYRDLYVNCTSNYINAPERIPLYDLKKEQKDLQVSYQLLSVLANEINGDQVLFNKVYNKIEDAGLFMTIPDKQNQKYLKQISTKLDNVMEGLKAVFDSLQETNRHLNTSNKISKEILEETSYVSHQLEETNSFLWDISYDLRNN